MLGTQMVMSLSPGTNLHQCLWAHLQVCGLKEGADMLTSIQSVGVTPEVNLRITQVRKHAKRDHPLSYPELGSHLDNPDHTLSNHNPDHAQGPKWAPVMVDRPTHWAPSARVHQPSQYLVLNTRANPDSGRLLYDTLL